MRTSYQKYRKFQPQSFTNNNSSPNTFFHNLPRFNSSSLLTQDVTKYHKAIASPYQDSNNLYDPSVVFAKLLDYPDKYSTVIILANQPVHHYLTKTSICWSHEQLHIKCCIAWCRHWRRHGCWLWIWRNRTWASARAGWNSVVYSPSKHLKL